jgi:hypothetical protein
MAYSDRIKIELSGGCQCGAVRYRITERFNNAHICHCRMCQKAMGNFFAPLVAIPHEAFTWTRGEPARFRSSAEVDRGFCAKCGTPLTYESVDSDNTTITIGSLDHPELIKPETQDGMQGRMPWFSSLHELTDTGDTGSDDREWAAAIARTSNQHPDHDTDAWPAEGAADGEG